MMGDSSKIAALILGDMGPKEDGKMSGFYESELENISKDIIKAIADKNALALKASLKAFMSACEMTEDEIEED